MKFVIWGEETPPDEDLDRTSSHSTLNSKALSKKWNRIGTYSVMISA